MIYILFGKAGVGKTYVGRLLSQRFGFKSFDGDDVLTKKMKDAIYAGHIFTKKMLAEYISNLSRIIERFYHDSRPVVLAQALYRNENRLALLKLFPLLRFVMISASDSVCYDRIKRREDGVSIDYARKIRPFFEEPVHPVIEMKNEVDGDSHIILQAKGLINV